MKALQKVDNGLKNFKLPYCDVRDTKTNFVKDLFANTEGDVPQHMQEAFHIAITPQPCNVSISSPPVTEMPKPPEIWPSDTLMKFYKAYLKEYLESDGPLRGLLPQDCHEKVQNMAQHSCQVL